jgi:hypothetical protein
LEKVNEIYYWENCKMVLTRANLCAIIMADNKQFARCLL